MVAFDETTMEWSIVSRVRMDKQGANAHALAFKKTFDKCKAEHPVFKLGETLLGVVVDWSDVEILGLGQAVGKELATTLLCGCKYTGHDRGNEFEIVLLNLVTGQEKSHCLAK